MVGWLASRRANWSAMRAANAIGDDAIQSKSRGRVLPHTFTHGTSAQRENWFRRGYDQQRVAACDTFGTDRL